MAEAPLSKPDITQTLAALLTCLDDRTAVALIGGLAVSSRVEPRFTRDVDFMVAVRDDEAAEGVVHGLVQRGFRVEATLENTKHQRLATVRLRRGPRAPLVDLLFASTGIEREVVHDAETLTVLGSRVRVARIGHLIALKLLARDDKKRPQDSLDLRGLSQAATAVEWRRASRAVSLIQERGFARRRDLAAALERLRLSVSGGTTRRVRR